MQEICREISEPIKGGFAEFILFRKVLIAFLFEYKHFICKKINLTYNPVKVANINFWTNINEQFEHIINKNFSLVHKFWFSSLS